MEYPLEARLDIACSPEPQAMSWEETTKEHRILSLDIGSTIILCCVFDCNMKELARDSEKMEYIYPAPRRVEISPDELWDKIVRVIKRCVKSGGMTVDDITSFGISAFRSTFMTWNKTTGKPFHNFISWQDARTEKRCKEWNNSYTMMALRSASAVLYAFTGSKRFLASRIFKFEPTLIATKLEWVMQNCEEMKEEIEKKNVCFGTLDTWLIWKFTNGKKFVSEIGHASSTSLFDPFLLDWSNVIIDLMKVPSFIFPEIIDTSGTLCEIDEKIFGGKLTLNSMVGDQNAAYFAEGCFPADGIVCTMGTGSFIDIATPKTHASMKGLYPQVGWQIDDELCMLAEGMIPGSAESIEWSKTLGLYEKVSETSDLAYSVADSGGVCFVPGLSNGIRVPVTDATACASFLGVNRNTTRKHLLRAILEGVAFSFCSLCETAAEEIELSDDLIIKVNGGISNNDFILDVISTVMNRTVIRSSNTNLSLVGAAHLAGLAVGVWSTHKEVSQLARKGDTFEPKQELMDSYKSLYTKWRNAVQRSLKWFQEKS